MSKVHSLRSSLLHLPSFPSHCLPPRPCPSLRHADARATSRMVITRVAYGLKRASLRYVYHLLTGCGKKVQCRWSSKAGFFPTS